MPARRPGAATAALAAVAVLSLVVLFAPQGAGEPRFPHDYKVVHLALFALLAASARWRADRTAVLLVVCAYAPLSEVVQAVALPYRSGDPNDVVADLLGVALGWAGTGRALARLRAPAEV